MSRATENHVQFVQESLQRAGYTVVAAHYLVGGTAGPDDDFGVGKPYGYDEWEYDREAALTVTGHGLTGQNTIMFIGSRSIDTAYIFGPDADLLGQVIIPPSKWPGDDEGEQDEEEPIVADFLYDHRMHDESDRMRVLLDFVDSLPAERDLGDISNYASDALAELLDRHDLSEEFGVWLDEHYPD